MSRPQASGGIREPPEGWPLNHVLVGVGTLRTLRELFHRQDPPGRSPLRAWDVALRSEVSVQGAAESLERLAKAGLVEELPPAASGRASRYRLNPHNPLTPPLARLFQVERRMVPRPRPIARARQRRLARERQRREREARNRQIREPPDRR